MNLTNCPLCGKKTIATVLNGLEYHRCAYCRFLFSTNSVALDHYAHKEAGLTKIKVQGRARNSFNRITVISPSADFNNVCDIGAGDGSMLAVAYDCGYRNLIGLEPADYIDSLAADKRVILVRGTLENLLSIVSQYNLKNASMFHVIEHLPEPMQVLRNIYQALPSGGCLIIETPDSDSYILQKSSYAHDLIYPEHVSLFNLSNLKRAVQNAGFTVVNVGRRDFDPPLSIHESLIRLGVVPYHIKKNRMKAAQSADENTSVEPSIFRLILRRVLYALIKVLRREDYIWLVARKP